MSFNIWNYVSLYKLSIPEEKEEEEKEKEKKKKGGPRSFLSFFLSLSSWPYRMTKYISAIDREIKWKKRKTTSTGPIPPHPVDIWLMIFN